MADGVKVHEVNRVGEGRVLECVLQGTQQLMAELVLTLQGYI